MAPDGYSLERQLIIAARRYAEARDVARKAREEFNVFDANGAQVEAIRIARTRADAADAQCYRLAAILRRLEAQLLASATAADRTCPAQLLSSNPSAP